jgi:hypothetical protein
MGIKEAWSDMYASERIIIILTGLASFLAIALLWNLGGLGHF